ncbi:response regulator [Bradyrhizobium sp. NAS80.1]|uniref:response regulator n=1 Tax=Bradyrhizobium sp. NAS80.1 TaxID=1680159 RepID=UPI00116137E2|nr:response regulator [Bradyrhizobium sp. NAS80.1]
MMTKAFFLVEDEALIRMMIADMIEELGHRVAAEAGTIDKAMSLARNCEFDVAILDVNLNGANIAPVAEIIAARKIPFLFASGYGIDRMPEAFMDRPGLRKPFQIKELDRTVRSLLSGTDETIA